jgi:hypothetical protein
LTALAGRQLRIFVEAGLECRGQTGRTWPIASRDAVENLGCHALSVHRDRDALKCADNR